MRLWMTVRKPFSAVSTEWRASTSGRVKSTDTDFDCNFKNSDRGELYGWEGHSRGNNT